MLYDDNKLVVSGVPDNRNVHSYIIDIPTRKTRLIPCNSGVLGFTNEEGYIIGESYRYVSDPELQDGIHIFNYLIRMQIK